MSIYIKWTNSFKNNLPLLAQYETDNLNRLITTKKI